MMTIYKPNLMLHFDAKAVIDLWRSGCDTRTIASKLWLTEAQVYNFLAQVR